MEDNWEADETKCETKWNKNGLEKLNDLFDDIEKSGITFD